MLLYIERVNRGSEKLNKIKYWNKWREELVIVVDRGNNR